MSATVRSRRRNLVRFDPLRDSRHRDARSARDLADWLAWLEISNKATRTLDSYERTCAVLLRAFPDKAFSEFTDGDILQVLRLFPPRSRHINATALRSWFKWGYQQRKIPANPADLLPSIRYKPSRIYDVFSEAESDALCALPSPDGKLMTILLWAGLRRAEARHLTGKRVDFEKRQIIVIDGAKGGKSRKVPLLDRVERAAADLMLFEGIGRDDFLWYDRPGGGHRIRRTKPVTNNSFGLWWRRSVDAAGVPYRKPHMTRHSFATALRAAGLPMEEIQQLLGHESIKTTSDTYVHTNLDSIGEHMRELIRDAV